MISDPDQSAARRAYDPWGNPGQRLRAAAVRRRAGHARAEHAPRAGRTIGCAASRRAAATRRTAATHRGIRSHRTARARGIERARGQAVAGGALEAFCRGAGVNSRPLPADGQERLLQLAGLLLRESLVGIKELARAQREIRQDSGLRVAADDPERLALQNLPVEELLVRLLQGHDQRQLDAVQWLRELFGFASRHDAALMRALRPALIEFTQRLDPASLSPGASAAERFRSITAMADGRLPHLFVESLARGYDTEIGGGGGKGEP